jgi:putative Mg2+ transporter-C (MgtC) family protein
MGIHLPHTILAKLLLSLILGGCVGIERELRSKSAGFRTIMLISLGATLFTILSQYVGRPSSPDRIAANIVVGIGFLGAGVIFRSEKGVNGITTAASIWLTAALGMGVGCGYYEASVLGCFLVVLVLFIFSFFDSFLDRLNQIREYKITYTYEEKQQHKYEHTIARYRLRILKRNISKNGTTITGRWLVNGSEKKHHAFIEHVLNDNTVASFDF